MWSLLITFLLISCGTSQKVSQVPSVPASSVVEIPKYDETESPDFQGRTSPRSNTYAVSNVSLLPPCDFSSEGYIAYVENTKSLKACIANDQGGYSWRELNFASKDEVNDIKDDLGSFVTKDDLPSEKSKLIYEQYRKSIYQIGKMCSDNSIGWSTGYKCGDGVICTNAHSVTCEYPTTFSRLSLYRVVDSIDTIENYFYRGVPTIKIANNSLIDLAKIFVPANTIATDKTFENSSTYRVSTLTGILSMSFPLGLNDLHTDLGHVRVNTVGDCEGYWGGGFCLRDYYDFYTSNDTDHGSSGSPLIDIETGKVVGVTSAGLPGDILMNPNIAISASWFTISSFWP